MIKNALKAFCSPGLPNDKSMPYNYSLIVLLCLIPIIGVCAPRVVAYLPSAIGLLGFLSFYIFYGFRPAVSKTYALCLGPVILLAALSTTWAINPDFAAERAAKIGLVFFGGWLLLAVLQALPVQVCRFLEKLLPVAFFVSAVFALIELSNGGAVYYALRPEKEIIDPTNLSHLNRMVVIVSLIFIVVFQSLRSRSKWFLLALSLLIMAPIVLKTHSQSAQVGVLVGLFFCFLFPYRSKIAYGLLAIVIAGVMFTAPWIAMTAFKTLPALMEGSEWLTRGASAPARMEIWDFISQRALEKPFFGHGIEATRAIKDFSSEMLYHRSTEVLHPHNFVLQIWIEFGAFGVLVVTGGILYLLYRISICSKSEAQIFLPALCMTLIMAGLSYGLWQGWWLGLMIATATYAIAMARADTQ